MRTLFRTRGLLTEIHSFHRSPFGAPGVEPVVIVLDSRRHHSHIDLFSHSDRLDLNIDPSARLSLEITERLPGGIIPLEWNERTEGIVQRMAAGGHKLGDEDSPFVPLIALQAYARGKGVPPQTEEAVASHPFHLRAPTEDSIPYLEGRDIGRYQIAWSGAHLRYGPWLAEHQPRERFLGPRIVVREILAHERDHAIIAAYTDEPYVYNRSVLHMLPRGDRNDLIAEKMWALLAVLNSRPISLWIGAVGRKSQRRLFPKILNEDLRLLPLPAEFIAPFVRDGALGRLAALARQISHSTPADESRYQAAPLNPIQLEIDREVAHLYGLTDAQLAHRNASCVG